MTPAVIILKTNQFLANLLVKLEAASSNKFTSPFIWFLICALLGVGKALALIERFLIASVDAFTPPDPAKWVKLSATLILFVIVMQISKIAEANRAELSAVSAEQKPVVMKPLPPLPPMPEIYSAEIK